MPRKIGSLTLYSVDDLHEMLGISKMTLRTYLREGRLRGRKLGVQWYVTEEAIRDYFEEEKPKQPADEKPVYRYIVQGVNDLVSETEECTTVPEALECLQSQAIISLFQVQIINVSTNEVVEVVKARDFMERHN
ncbi:MAG: DNA-binding protein [Balneolaceae bacterium]|nr:MAG: DNA-binding protein [Balneolaceae bacterium]